MINKLLRMAAIDVSSVEEELMSFTVDTFITRLDQRVAENPELKAALDRYNFSVDEFVRGDLAPNMIEARVKLFLQELGEGLENSLSQLEDNPQAWAEFRNSIIDQFEKSQLYKTLVGALEGRFEEAMKQLDITGGVQTQIENQAQSIQQEGAVFKLANTDLPEIKVRILHNIDHIIDTGNIKELEDVTPEFKQSVKVAMKTKVETGDKDIKMLFDAYNNKDMISTLANKEAEYFKNEALPTWAVIGSKDTGEGFYSARLLEVIAQMAGIEGNPEEARMILEQFGSTREAIKQFNAEEFAGGDTYFSIFGHDIFFTPKGKQVFLQIWLTNLGQDGLAVGYAFFDRVRTLRPDHPGLDGDKNTLAKAMEGLGRHMRILSSVNSTWEAAVGATGTPIPLAEFLIKRNLNQLSHNEFAVMAQGGRHVGGQDVRLVFEFMQARNLFYPMKEKNSYNRWDMVIYPRGMTDFKDFVLANFDADMWDLFMVSLAMSNGPVATFVQGLIKAISGTDIVQEMKGLNVKDILSNYDRVLGTGMSTIQSMISTPGAAGKEKGGTPVKTQNVSILNLLRKVSAGSEGDEGKEEVKRDKTEKHLNSIIKKLIAAYGGSPIGKVEVSVTQNEILGQDQKHYVINNIVLTNIYFSKMRTMVTHQSDNELMQSADLPTMGYEKLGDMWVAEKYAGYADGIPTASFKVITEGKALTIPKGKLNQWAKDMFGRNYADLSAFEQVEVYQKAKETMKPTSEAQKSGPPVPMSSSLIDEIFTTETAHPVKLKSRIQYIKNMLNQYLKKHPGAKGNKSLMVAVLKHYAEQFEDSDLLKNIEEFEAGDSNVAEDVTQFTYGPSTEEEKYSKGKSEARKLAGMVIATISIIKRKYGIENSKDISDDTRNDLLTVVGKIKDLLVKIKQQTGQNPSNAYRMLGELQHSIQTSEFSRAKELLGELGKTLSTYRTVEGAVPVQQIMFELQMRFDNAASKDYASILMQELEAVLPQIDENSDVPAFKRQVRQMVAGTLEKLNVGKAPKSREPFSREVYDSALEAVKGYAEVAPVDLPSVEEIKRHKELLRKQLNNPVYRKEFIPLKYIQGDSAAMLPAIQQVQKRMQQAGIIPKVEDDSTTMHNMRQKFMGGMDTAIRVSKEPRRPEPLGLGFKPMPKGMAAFIQRQEQTMQDAEAMMTRLEQDNPGTFQSMPAYQAAMAKHREAEVQLESSLNTMKLDPENASWIDELSAQKYQRFMGSESGSEEVDQSQYLDPESSSMVAKGPSAADLASAKDSEEEYYKQTMTPEGYKQYQQEQQGEEQMKAVMEAGRGPEATQRLQEEQKAEQTWEDQKNREKEWIDLGWNVPTSEQKREKQVEDKTKWDKMREKLRGVTKKYKGPGEI